MYAYTSKMKMMKRTSDDENDGNESDDENLRLSSRGVEPRTQNESCELFIFIGKNSFIIFNKESERERREGINMTKVAERTDDIYMCILCYTAIIICAKAFESFHHKVTQ